MFYTRFSASDITINVKSDNTECIPPRSLSFKEKNKNKLLFDSILTRGSQILLCTNLGIYLRRTGRRCTTWQRCSFIVSTIGSQKHQPLGSSEPRQTMQLLTRSTTQGWCSLTFRPQLYKSAITSLILCISNDKPKG